MKTSPKIEWRIPTLAEWLAWETGYPLNDPLPLEVWVKSVDGVPMNELSVEQRLVILPDVFDFLGKRRDRMKMLADSASATNIDGNSSPPLKEISMTDYLKT